MRCVLATLWLLAATLTHAATVVPKAPTISASGWMLQDFASGRVLAEHNAHGRLEPASLTKMMTAYVVFAELQQGSISLEDDVLVSEKAWKMPGSRMFIEVDKQVRVEDLLKGVIIQSGNDASVALAEYVAGDESTFSALMNQHAKRLGMTGTNYVNSTGLPDPEHYTTATDLALLARALIMDFPELYKWHAVKSFTHNDITQDNRNSLLWRDESVDGIKTGHTESAGYCLVASAVRNDMRIISVVLGTSSTKARTQQTQALLNYGFRFFETHKLYEAGDALTSVRVWKGDRQELELGVRSDLYITIPKGQYDNVQAKLDLMRKIEAPVVSGESYGTVTLTLGEKEVASRPLVALESVAEGGLWDQMSDSVQLWFE